MLFLRSVFFTLILPGTVTVIIPSLILSRQPIRALAQWAVPQYAGAVEIVIGTAILLRCIWDFARIGRGTLAPIDPPTKLVVKGLYRYVRNPMYVGVLLLLLGEAITFESVALLLYTALWFIAVHLFVVLYEEPALRRRFGAAYDRYCDSVRRWLPGKRFDQSS